MKVSILISVFLLANVPSFVLYSQNVASSYKKYFQHFKDNRTITERVLNTVGLTNQDVGRSFALLADISTYPYLPAHQKHLTPASEDIRKLKNYLITYEFFDEVVVLENENVTLDNFEFFLQNYFPARVRQFPKSRFLLVFSGHGMQDDNRRGFILKHTAASLTDKSNAINTQVLKTYVDEVTTAAHHTLVLLNSCYSGSFLRRQLGGSSIPKYPGAHAITAGGANETAFHDPLLGTGSVFVEKLLAGLNGIADANHDGIVLYSEIASYLRAEVSIFTDQHQNPHFGDISRDGSSGEFFFLNRRRQVEEKNVPTIEFEKAKPMGELRVEKILKTADSLMSSYNLGEAYQAYLMAAKLRNPRAMYQLGYMNEKAIGLKKNEVEAFHWYHESANVGYVDSYGALGDFYNYGWGIEKDYAQAFQWYTKAAESGSVEGIVGLGIMYREGNAMPADYEMALKLFLSASEKGSRHAMANIGYLYETGLGVQQDSVTSFEWYKKAAELNNPYAMDKVSHFYSVGLRGVEKNYSEAFVWAINAANLGEANGMVRVGYYFMEGIGVKSNYESALFWYQKAADLGNPRGMASIGHIYEKGFGVGKDYATALEWYNKAAQAGDSWAINRLKELGAN